MPPTLWLGTGRSPSGYALVLGLEGKRVPKVGLQFRTRRRKAVAQEGLHKSGQAADVKAADIGFCCILGWATPVWTPARLNSNDGGGQLDFPDQVQVVGGADVRMPSRSRAALKYRAKPSAVDAPPRTRVKTEANPLIF